MKREIGLLSINLMGLLWVYCASVGPTANGGSGTETTTGITAIAVYANGTPAVGAVARIRRYDYVTQPPSLAKSLLFGADALTDGSGRFEITGIDTGSYRIEVTDGQSAMLLACSLDVRDTLDLGTDTLRPFATITGTVDTGGRAGQQAYVQVEGLERLAAVDEAGRFVLNDIPAGTFAVRAVTAYDTAVAVASGISVGPGAQTSVTIQSGWGFSKRLYLNTTATGANVAEDVTSFPLLIRLDATNFDFTQARDSGQDVRFTNADGSMLPYEIEQWDRASPQAAIWVRMDTVRGNDSTQWIGTSWGNPSAASASSGTAVFDTADGFAAIYHLGDDSSTVRDDASAGRSDAITYGFDSSEPVHGIVGACDSLGAGKFMISNAVVPQDGFTLEAWICPASQQSWSKIIYQALDSIVTKNNCRFTLQLDTVTTGKIIFGVTTQNGQHIVASQSSVKIGTWTYAAGVFDGSSIFLYVNGMLEASEAAPGQLVQSDRKVYISGTELYSDDQVRGKLDEIRISRAPRNESWIRLCRQNQKAGSTVVR